MQKPEKEETWGHLAAWKQQKNTNVKSRLSSTGNNFLFFLPG
jgi:hypothetical protein